MVLAFIGTQFDLLCFEVSTYDMIFLSFIETRKGPVGRPDLIVDDGGDATLLIHEGVKAEEEFKKTRKFPDSSSTDNAEYQIVFSIIKEWLQSDQKKYHKMKDRLVGVSEETTTSVKRLYQMQLIVHCFSPTINANDSVTKSKPCRWRLNSNSRRGTPIGNCSRNSTLCLDFFEDEND
ncbi:hypothetical protein L1987_66215 [Smallanthus sonchifolius]|uniref:Uncharacterized protein n=1 Tax=Smallanthus sonchifolius TaxID=185202 RepID=A0ACB9BWN5_9ASTR|nr:hypothetical protein L1987_66215 [Smallanthus sonchifolius]